MFALEKDTFIASVTLLSAMSGLTTQTGMAVAAARKVAEKVTIGAGSSSGRISAMADGEMAQRPAAQRAPREEVARDREMSTLQRRSRQLERLTTRNSLLKRTNVIHRPPPPAALAAR